MQNLDEMIAKVVAAIDEPSTDTPPPPDTTLRERMFELVVIAMGFLYPRMPDSGQIYDRVTISRVTTGLDDGEAASLGKRTDDWLRLEGVTKQEEGKRAYFLPFNTLAALSTPTQAGTLGDICAKVKARYAADHPSENLRVAARALGAEVFLRLKG